MKIDFYEYLIKHNRFLRIGFDNLPAEYLVYSGFLLTELHMVVTQNSTTAAYMYTSHQTLLHILHNHSYPHHTRYTTTATKSQQTPLRITADTTTHHTRHHFTSHQTPSHTTSYPHHTKYHQDTITATQITPDTPSTQSQLPT